MNTNNLLQLYDKTKWDKCVQNDIEFQFWLCTSISYEVYKETESA